MAADSKQTTFPPSDVERLETIARLIEIRLAELSTRIGSPGFTAAEARELYVLQDLRDNWIAEARK